MNLPFLSHFKSTFLSKIVLWALFWVLFWTQNLPWQSNSHECVPQVAAHLFQAGANIVKLGIQKTRGSSPDKYLGLYWDPTKQTFTHIIIHSFFQVFVTSFIWAILPERVHYWRNILSCTARTSKHLIKKNIGQFICIPWPSLDHKNIFDKLKRLLRYRHIKMRQW